MIYLFGIRLLADCPECSRLVLAHCWPLQHYKLWRDHFRYKLSSDCHSHPVTTSHHSEVRLANSIITLTLLLCNFKSWASWAIMHYWWELNHFLHFLSFGKATFVLTVDVWGLKAGCFMSRNECRSASTRGYKVTAQTEPSRHIPRYVCSRGLRLLSGEAQKLFRILYAVKYLCYAKYFLDCT